VGSRTGIINVADLKYFIVVRDKNGNNGQRGQKVFSTNE